MTLLVANWKMGLSKYNSINLASMLCLVHRVTSKHVEPETQIAIAPSFPMLYEVGNEISGSTIKLAAQDCSINEKGAFTGEVSAQMLADYRCKYVILGHSERKIFHNETSEDVAKKVSLVHKHNMTPIICVGEKAEDKERSLKVIEKQLIASLPTPLYAPVIISYEPIWAIGTGQNPTTTQIESAAWLIIKVLKSNFKLNNKKILYGGSVNPENCKNILKIPGIGGLLIGGASLEYERFVQIIKAAVELEKCLT